MAKVKIVTDSTADIPQALVQELDITVLPLKIHFQKEEYVDATSMVPSKLHYGKETFIDGITMTSEEFYQRLETSIELPETSIPTEEEFTEAYQQLNKQEDDVQILSIHISSALSETVRVAEAVRDKLQGEVDITVLDSKTATYGMGMLVVAAARAAKEGASLEACVHLVQTMIKQSTIFFLVDRLEYLYRSGRIGLGAALGGFLLRVKPILSLNEQGAVYALTRARGRAEALERFTQLARDYIGTETCQLSIAQGQAMDEALVLKEKLKVLFPVQDIPITPIGPVVGRYVGPKTIGLIIVKGDYPSKFLIT